MERGWGSKGKRKEEGTKAALAKRPGTGGSVTRALPRGPRGGPSGAHVCGRFHGRGWVSWREARAEAGRGAGQCLPGPPSRGPWELLATLSRKEHVVLKVRSGGLEDKERLETV